MQFNPKVLNKTNAQYGQKLYAGKWKDTVRSILGTDWVDEVQPSIKSLCEEGDYLGVIKKSSARLKRFEKIGHLENMTEADLANFYYLGRAYIGLAEIDKAISCLHIVASQNLFTHTMMIGFDNFVEMAWRDIRELSAQHGEEYVMNNEPGLFLEETIGRPQTVFNLNNSKQNMSKWLILGTIAFPVLIAA